MNSRARGTRRLACALLLVGTLGACSTGSKPPTLQSNAGACGERGAQLQEGDALPAACTIRMLDGDNVVTLGSIQQGKPLVVNFWASWCTYCIKEMPDFQRVYDQAAGRIGFLGLDLLGLQGETKAAAVQLAAQTGVTYPLAFDENGSLYGRVAPRLLMPTTLLVRADGTIAYRQFGPLDARELTKLIKTHLGLSL